MRDLSVLIPSRNEPYLGHTIADVLAHTTADTEIIAVCDGEWPVEPIPDHPRVQLIYLPTAIGQRAATNFAARLSTARYVMKLDAHCAVSPGFDATLIQGAEALGLDVTQIPVQYHLHIFNRRCTVCGYEEHHGPTVCRRCHGVAETRWIWERRQSRPRLSTDEARGGYVQSTAWGFGPDLVFQYFGSYQQRPEGQQRPFSDTLSCLGACWFLARRRYWALGGLDEDHGGWGQMGTELGCKAWLSGGRMVVNHDAWFAHLFRTQGGSEWGFPYPLTQAEVNVARAYSQHLWTADRWPLAVRSLASLIEQFAPVPNWPLAQQEEQAS